MSSYKKLRMAGFTLTEVMVVVSILSILAVITYGVSVTQGKERAQFTATISDLTQMGQAAKLFVTNNDDYPAAVSVNVLPGQSGQTQNARPISTPYSIQKSDSDTAAGKMPKAQWAGAQYHYEYLSDGTVQVELRFCADSSVNPCAKPKGDWAKDMLASGATMYYCVKAGTSGCRSTGLNSDGSVKESSTPSNGICVGGYGCQTPKYN